MELKDISGIGPAKEDKLKAAGIKTVRDLAGADVDALATKTGIAKSALVKFRQEALGETLVSDVAHVGKGTLKVAAKQSAEQAKDAAMYQIDHVKAIIERESEELQKRVTSLRDHAVDLAKHLRTGLQSSEGRKQLLKEGKDASVQLAHTTKATATQLAHEAKDQSEALAKKAKELPAKIKDLEAKAKELEHQIQAKAKELEAKAKELSHEVASKAKAAGSKSKDFVKAESEKIRETTKSIRSRARKSD